MSSKREALHPKKSSTKESDAKRDDKAITLDVMPELHEKQAYISLQDLCREFGCTYSYDETNYQATISGDLQKGSLPASYDLREKDRVSAVRNQGDTKGCHIRIFIIPSIEFCQKGH